MDTVYVLRDVLLTLSLDFQYIGGTMVEALGALIPPLPYPVSKITPPHSCSIPPAPSHYNGVWHALTTQAYSKLLAIIMKTQHFSRDENFPIGFWTNLVPGSIFVDSISRSISDLDVAEWRLFFTSQKHTIWVAIPVLKKMLRLRKITILGTG